MTAASALPLTPHKNSGYETRAATGELEPRKPWIPKSWGVPDFLADQEGLASAPGLAYPPDPGEAPASEPRGPSSLLAGPTCAQRAAAPPLPHPPSPQPSPTRLPQAHAWGSPRAHGDGDRGAPTSSLRPGSFPSPGTLQSPTPGPPPPPPHLSPVRGSHPLARPAAGSRTRSLPQGLWVRARSGLRQRKGRGLWGVT